ncbi:hypothetical protein KAI68_04890 [bacterium]|nr:hypothetical protein [bacterium]
MKKSKFILFALLVFFMWSSKTYASCFNEKSFLFGLNTQDFCFRAKIQFLPLYLVFPDLDIRDENNKPVKNYNNLFLNDAFQFDEVFIVWAIIEKKKIINSIRSKIVNLNKLEIVNVQNRTRCFPSFFFSEADDLFLKLKVFLC